MQNSVIQRRNMDNQLGNTKPTGNLENKENALKTIAKKTPEGKK